MGSPAVHRGEDVTLSLREEGEDGYNLPLAAPSFVAVRVQFPGLLPRRCYGPNLIFFLARTVGADPESDDAGPLVVTSTVPARTRPSCPSQSRFDFDRRPDGRYWGILPSVRTTDCIAICGLWSYDPRRVLRFSGIEWPWNPLTITRVMQSGYCRVGSVRSAQYYRRWSFDCIYCAYVT